MGLALLRTKKVNFAGRLAAMTEMERRAFVERARQESRWPPQPWWLPTHVTKHGNGRSIPEFCRWVQEVKSRSGVQVFAFVHPIHANEGIAFHDPADNLLVWVNTEDACNVSIVEVDEILKHQLTSEDGQYWRLPDTEITHGTRT